MPLAGIVKPGEYTENLAIWLNNPAYVSNFIGREVTDTKWDTAADIEFAGANYIQTFFWAQKQLGTANVGSQTKKMDIEIHARKQASAAIYPVLIARVEFGPDDKSLSIPSGSRPISDVTIDNTARWYLATNIDFSLPTATEYPYAFNAFGARAIKGAGLGSFLQIPTLGFTEFMMRVRQVGDADAPSRFLVLSGAR